MLHERSLRFSEAGLCSGELDSHETSISAEQQPEREAVEVSPKIAKGLGYTSFGQGYDPFDRIERSGAKQNTDLPLRSGF